MNLESQKITVEKSAEYLFNTLTDVKSFEKLMPENIAKFQVTADDAFIFALSGMPEIHLKMLEKTPTSKIALGAADGKIPFTLIININEVSGTTSGIQFHFSGNFNPMMAMMVKGPISKFIETLAQNTSKL